MEPTQMFEKAKAWFGFSQEQFDAKVAEETQAEEAAKVQAAEERESRKQLLREQIISHTDATTAAQEELKSLEESDVAQG